MSRKYIGYAGQIAIVFVSLYLLFTVGMDFYLYDVEYSDGSDDARWTIPNESWDYENTIGLLWWGFYLLVTGIHLFLYFVRLGSTKKFNMWSLPTFNIGGMRILSVILSLSFILFVFFFIQQCQKFLHQVYRVLSTVRCHIMMELILSGQCGSLLNGLDLHFSQPSICFCI